MLNSTTVTTTVGILGGILVTGSLVPQLVKLVRSRSGADLSFSMFLLFALGEVLWSLYAGNRRDWILMTFKIASCLLAIAILAGILSFRHRRK